MKRLALWLVSAAAILLVSGSAHAIDVTSGELTFVDGEIGMVDPVAVGKGGTGVAGTGTDDVVLVGAGGSAFAEKALPASCAGNGAQFLYDTTTNTFSCETLTNADLPDPITVSINLQTAPATLDLDEVDPTTNVGRVAYDDTAGWIEVGTSGGSEQFPPLNTGAATDTYLCSWDATNGEIDCETSPSAAADGPGSIFFSTMGTLSAGTPTIYAIPGDVSATEANVEVPTVAATFSNIYCEADGVPGGTGDTVTITGRVGTCGSLGDSSMVCGIDAAATTCNDTSNNLVATAGQCISFAITGVSNANAVRVQCSVERTV
jgi:hypothetical protein